MRLDMPERGQRPKNAGIADHHIESSETLVQGRAEPVDAQVVLEVERHERGRSAQALDRIVELLEPADGARERDNMGAGFGERERGGVADAARGAGDERDTVGEGKGHRCSLVNSAAQTSLRSLRRLDCTQTSLRSLRRLDCTQTSLRSLRRLDCSAGKLTQSTQA